MEASDDGKTVILPCSVTMPAGGQVTGGCKGGGKSGIETLLPKPADFFP